MRIKVYFILASGVNLSGVGFFYCFANTKHQFFKLNMDNLLVKYLYIKKVLMSDFVL